LRFALRGSRFALRASRFTLRASRFALRASRRRIEKYRFIAVEIVKNRAVAAQISSCGCFIVPKQCGNDP
jgi:hypothetical protein